MSDEQRIDPALLEDANPAGLNPSAAVNGGINLKEKPKGIRKINNKGLLIGGGILATAAIVATTTFNGTGQAVSTAAQQAVASQQSNSRPAEVKRDALWYGNVPDKVASADPSFVPPVSPSAQSEPGTPGANPVKLPFPTAGLPPPAGTTGGTVVPDLTGKAVSPLGGAVAAKTGSTPYDPANPGATGGVPLTPAQQTALQAEQLKAQQKQQAEQLKAQELGQASKAGLAASGFGGGQGAPAQTAGQASAAPGGAISAGTPIPGMAKQGEDDPNKQDQKAAFLRAQRELVDPAYSSSYKTAPRSLFELKAGGMIPAVLISGVNSDLPGQAIAQVRENVYDTKTGQHLLIPQGTRIVGLYDSYVASGQQRVLMAWNRLVFSDGANFDLKGMPGSDMGGFAGFFDEVDNHYVKIFGSSAVLSLISAGVQLSQPNYGGSNNSQPGVGQTIGGALGQQLGQTGMSITQKNLNIQPTLQIRSGYKFNIMVTADLILEPKK